LYLLLPAPAFPTPPTDSVQSLEEADTETPLKKAYFTNYSRAEVIEHYNKQFYKSDFYNIPFLNYRLNYPPEDAQTLIRDQTRSTFLEEIVHPLRESLFINGFEAKLEKDDIWYKGVHYDYKIIIKYVPGNLMVRLLIAVLIVVGFYFVITEWKSAIEIFIKNVRKH
jgi:hypothetical protein